MHHRPVGLLSLVLSCAVLALVRCHSGDSPTEPFPAPTPLPSPSPTPTLRCAQLAGSYQRSVATSTCIGERFFGGPTVREVAECTFEAYDTVVGATVTLEAVANSGTVTLVWSACQGRATGTFVYDGSSINATFAGVLVGTDSSCCGSTTGSFQWVYRH